MLVSSTVTACTLLQSAQARSPPSLCRAYPYRTVYAMVHQAFGSLVTKLIAKELPHCLQYSYFPSTVGLL